MGREGHPLATPATATPCWGEANAAIRANIGPTAMAGGSHLARVAMEEEDGHRCAEGRPPPWRGPGTKAVALLRWENPGERERGSGEDG